MTGLWRRIDQRLVAPGPGFRVAEVQILLAAVIALRLATRDWTLVAERPAALRDGLTVLSWYTGIPAPWALVVAQVVGLGCALLVLAQVRPHLAFVGLWVAYTSLTALWGSSGKVMHNDVLTVLVAAVFLFASGPPRSGWSEVRVRYGWPPRAALAVLALAYFVSGAQKLVHSGPEWVFGDTMVWVLRLGLSAHLSGGVEPVGQDLAHVVAEHGWMAVSLAGGALLLELTAPVWLAIRRTRIPFVAAVTLMHGSIWLFIGLDYSAWPLTVAAVAVPMALAPDRALWRRPAAVSAAGAPRR
ncbi:hypothetical protein [Cellulomonas xylanilytica]|uniref:HTTM domain-containing protein n=1 Tax=Cellulomonas xylanilytica TaxID=233583 RepID=A0A510V6J7_9CELL|nr:hypothetical protein [Cellulomonas xylanilytica]GEK22498.1 hypothetical protein CXY01_30180 [Cellulomonas xylanilytica]